MKVGRSLETFGESPGISGDTEAKEGMRVGKFFETVLRGADPKIVNEKKNAQK